MELVIFFIDPFVPSLEEISEFPNSLNALIARHDQTNPEDTPGNPIDLHDVLEDRPFSILGIADTP